MSYLLILASALAMGAAAVRHLPLRFHAFEYVAMSVVLGLVGWTWLAFLACLVLPIVPAITLTTVVAAGVAGALAFPSRRRPWEFAGFASRGDRRLWFAVTAATVAVLAPLYSRVSLTSESTGIYSAGSSWADYGVHSAIVTHIANSHSMPMDLPVASGEKLTYPFLIDLLSALLVRSGASLHVAFLLPGLLLALAICQLVLGFSLRLFDHLGAAVTTLVLFLCTGTALGLADAWRDWRHSGRNPVDFFLHPPTDYTTLSDQNGNVSSLVSHALLPQRSLLFGLGLALVIFRLLQASRIGPRSAVSARLTLLAGALIGLLPMAHPHSFLVCLGVLLVLTVEAAVSARALPRAHALALGLAVGLALPQLMWQQHANGHGTGGRLRWAWMKQPGESALHFWWINFGLMGVLFLAIPVVLVRRRDFGLLVWCVPFLGVLAVSQIYAFQPFEYDNLKLLYYVYFMGALFAGYVAVLAYRASKYSLLAVVPLAVAVSLPGALSISRQFALHDQFAGVGDEQLAAWVEQHTVPTDVFLTTDRPNNPISALAGRTIVLGYTGWLFNFSIPYADRVAAAKAALAGNVDDPLVRRYGPKYLAVAGGNDPSWPVDRAALGRLPAVYTSPEWTVYRLF